VKNTVKIGNNIVAKYSSEGGGKQQYCYFLLEKYKNTTFAAENGLVPLNQTTLTKPH